jgi:predicted membrane-bound spermidine synthase
VNKLRIRLNRLEIIALVCGFVLMVFELAAARILAPGIGSSTYVWTSVIGIIIAALSLGYWTGGKVADQRGQMIDVARLLLLAAITIVITVIQYQGTIGWVAESFDDSRWQGVIASLILFAPTSFVLGMISPYLAKLNVRSLKTTGRSIASLSALNSIGGIIGTFLTGFFLFGYIGSHETLVLTVALLVAASWLVVPREQLQIRAIITVCMLVTVIVPTANTSAISIDTPSAHYTITDTNQARVLTTGPNGAQSGIYLNPEKDNDLVFWYTQQLADLVAAAPAKKNILVLGGGTFTLPKYLASHYPDSNIDVVEIDPNLADIARQYFRYDDSSNVSLIFSDARTYVNKTDKTYDIVLVDVYGDMYVPFTFLTREYGDKLNDIVSQNGVVAANMIAGLNGDCLELLDALDAPYRAHFEDSIYTLQNPDLPRSNMILAYSHQPINWPGAESIDIQGSPRYTDNFAPAERLQHECWQYIVTVFFGFVESQSTHFRAPPGPSRRYSIDTEHHRTH